MKIQFLGTAAAEGVPALFCSCPTCKRARELGGNEIRTRSQSLIDDKLMIDFSADTLHHCVTQNIDLFNIHHYIITHVHEDHFYPDDIVLLRPGYANLPEGTPPYHFYGSEEMVYKLAPHAGLTEGRLIPHFIYPYQTEQIAGMEVTPLEAEHGTKSPFNYIIKNGDKTMLYAHDTGKFLPKVIDYLGSTKPHFDFISLDCTNGIRERDQWGGHMCLNSDIEMREKLRSLGCVDDRTICYVNHFSHNSPHILYEDRGLYEKEGFGMSCDGKIVEF